MEEVRDGGRRTAEDTSVVDSERFFLVARPRFFPERIGRRCGCKSLPNLVDWCFEKAKHCPCTRLRGGDVTCVSGDPLVGNAVDSHEVGGVISLANNIGITAKSGS